MSGALRSYCCACFDACKHTCVTRRPVCFNTSAPKLLLLTSCLCQSLGLLSIALTNEEYADEAVRTPLVAAACAYLKRAALQQPGDLCLPDEGNSIGC